MPALDYASLRMAAKSLVPILESRSAEAEELRRLPEDTIADLRRLGLTRLCQPKRVGGAELPLDQSVDIITTLARGCASTAWVCAVYVDHAASIGMFDSQLIDEIWAGNPNAVVSAGITPSGHAERVDDGWRISGIWSWSSGCDYADWLMLAVPFNLTADSPPELHMCLVPREDVKIDDDWHVVGLAATGSKTLVIENAFVPDHRTIAAAQANDGSGAPTAEARSPLYRLSRASTVPFLLVAPAVGTAEAVLDAHVKNLSERQSRGTRVAEFATTQMHVAEASAEIDSARLLMMRDCRTAMEAAASGREWTMIERARGRRDQAYVTMLCRRAVDRLFTASGGGGLTLSDPLQRRFRDIHAISGHFALNWDVGGTTFGRVALGLTSGPMLI